MPAATHVGPRPGERNDPSPYRPRGRTYAASVNGRPAYECAGCASERVETVGLLVADACSTFYCGDTPRAQLFRDDGNHSCRRRATSIETGASTMELRNRYIRYMAALRTLSDADLAQRIRRLRDEQLRRAGKIHKCVQCANVFHARAGALYCSTRCRVAAFRSRAGVSGMAGSGGAR
jgi:hypothetical protein